VDLQVKEQAMGRSKKRRSAKRWVAGVVGVVAAMAAVGATQDAPPAPTATPTRAVMAPSRVRAAAVPTRTVRKVPRPKPTSPKPTITKPQVRGASLAAPACDPNYTGACLDPSASDYDCEGGSGNGPRYTGRVRVVGSDHFGLDRDGDGVGC
jgi:hypothetical protein